MIQMNGFRMGRYRIFFVSIACLYFSFFLIDFCLSSPAMWLRLDDDKGKNRMSISESRGAGEKMNRMIIRLMKGEAAKKKKERKSER